MRYIICQEGVESVPGQYVPIGAMEWSEELKIPVTWNFNDKIIGVGTDIRREENGVITAEIELLHEDKKYIEGLLKKMDDWCFSTFMSPAYFHRWKDILWITRAQIRGLAIVPEYSFWSNKPQES